MLNDRYGNALSTSSAIARDHYVTAVDCFLASNFGAEDAFSAAIEADQNFTLAHLGLARCLHVLGQGSDARAALARARKIANGLSPGEAGQLQVLGLLIDGKAPLAYTAVREHLLEFPRDAMVAQTCMGVFSLIGFSGQPGREAEHLAFTTSLAPAYGDDWWFQAQHAFAQIEAGQLGAAEKTMLKAQAGNSRSGSTAHYQAHIYYETGEQRAGLDYLQGWVKDYDRRSLLHCHLSWHIALWLLNEGRVTEMWQLIDKEIAPGAAWGPAINVLTDMAALLYRAELVGVEVPAQRWQSVSEYALASFPKTGLAFVDVHAAIAHAMAGNNEALQKIIDEARGPAADVVKTLAQAFDAIAAHDWSLAIVHLCEGMIDHARIGGSRAQRDLIEFATTAALLKSGQADEARRMLSMRRPVIASDRLFADFSAKAQDGYCPRSLTR
ncbi:MAG: hypothetical protein ACI9LO_001326 [Planctomycetota bacterium]|jgi:hypothetical protein